MEKPDIPYNEQARLKALHSLEILDTAAEERFDRLTRLAQRMFNVPIALVSLVDRDRQWFKSAIGLDVTETHRDISFCGHTILGDDVFNIPDASQDKRFADNPLVTEAPNIRLYAGCPLKSLDGHKLGTLCLIDAKPRHLNQDDIQALRDLACMAEQELMAAQLATLDDLTMITNRRGFMLLADKALQICARNRQAATFLAIDLNDFKQINDRFGHHQGDQALVQFTHLLLQTFRDSDIIARMGGDEFSVLLTNTTEEQALDSLMRLRYLVSDFNKDSEQPYQLDFSAGICPVNFQQPYDMLSLLKQCDKQMYQDKMSRQLR
ncbi:GGDEF domain-containing protein [Amphritea balenae]|uniref:Sensor domain-containing diguanylate cyclase n=1 Tax=Amphritea balenae TaxID=452629 RepID=A0A3P1SKB6_9GAMM|nr:sensor domain-containing diguanylate cyclase [Amphritea balenae]RRC97733.1 sensor domain-containing diguanylate cyclase [Amphritea balenae]GGK82577.1 GGDEF domain-containing protein [Amphritea balenae]